MKASTVTQHLAAIEAVEKHKRTAITAQAFIVIGVTLIVVGIIGNGWMIPFGFIAAGYALGIYFVKCVNDQGRSNLIQLEHERSEAASRYYDELHQSYNLYENYVISEFDRIADEKEKDSKTTS